MACWPTLFEWQTWGFFYTCGEMFLRLKINQTKLRWWCCCCIMRFSSGDTRDQCAYEKHPNKQTIDCWEFVTPVQCYWEKPLSSESRCYFLLRFYVPTVLFLFVNIWSLILSFSSWAPHAGVDFSSSLLDREELAWKMLFSWMTDLFKYL